MEFVHLIPYFSFFLLQKHSLEGFPIVLFWHYSGVYGEGRDDDDNAF